MKEQIGKVLLNYDYYSGEDLYSEGEIEDKLLDIVKKQDRSEWNQILASTTEWSLLYHLSHIRTNLVEWLPMEKTEHVLEIGAGCGAITDMLVKKAGHVTSIELSKKRSHVNAWRNKDCDNLEIIVGNFEEIERKLEKKYDYITLIGVLEYAGVYLEDKNPFETMLKSISKHLNKDGKIVIAIENKFGLKYWAGCKEDHTGTWFEGIEGYPTEKGVKTFSKQELTQLAKRSGFDDITFYYPYPDYKFPYTIYSDEYLPKIGELVNNRNNFDQDRVILFDEAKVFDSIMKENKFDFYSNSYLVILKKGEI